MASFRIILIAFYDIKGHEGCGKIVSIGDQVQDAGFKIVSFTFLAIRTD